jgi:general secretion pathway protein G
MIASLHRPAATIFGATPRGRAIRGFTLIEMLVVMTLIALLLTLAVPRYFHSLDNGRLNVQRQNISTMRDAIDKFYGDLGRYPDVLDDLVAKRYLRQIPLDPVTETTNWTIVPPLDTTLGNVFDVQPPPKVERVSAEAN